MRRSLVPAVRDFPDGCGPIEGDSSDVGNLMKRPMSLNHELEEFELSVALATVNVADSVIPSKYEVSELPMNSQKLETTALTKDPVLSCGLQATLTIKDESIEEKAPSWNFLPRRKIYAIRDFPSSCGQYAPCLDKEDCVTTLVTCESTGISQKRTVAEDKFKNGTIEKESHGTMLRKSNIVKKNQVCTKGVGPYLEMDREVVPALKAAPNCTWRQQEEAFKPDLGNQVSLGKKHELSKQGKSTFGFSLKKKHVTEKLGTQSLKSRRMSAAYHKVLKLYGHDDVESFQDEEPADSHELNVYLPPFGQTSSSGKHGDHGAVATRNKVRETLRMFQVVCRKILQGEEAKSKHGGGNGIRRIDLVANGIVKSKGKYVNTGKSILGSVPGVEVGDEFQYRVELAMVGLHRPLQAGIDSVKVGSKLYATSVVASGAYDDDLDDADMLVYMGCGGNRTGTNNQPEDQKLEGGNLALRNSALEKRAVRVIRGFKKLTYDGLYTVDRCWQEKAEPDGKLVFKFLLLRIRDQPELAWSEVNKSKKLKIRPGVCITDISQGKEMIPICAINTINDEKPPQFRYISKIIYPDWCKRIPPKGCGCTHGCLECDKCSCAIKNGSVVPYNHNGAIVENKPLVYECGRDCKCPSSCYNRVSQHGIKIQLEIFKTVSRGWGVRSVNSISSGSFICEYLGELLDDKEAEKRTGSDEYLFDIGRNYSGGGSSEDVEDDGGFTIDAARYGNVGRFINHSCSPNLYAQNVLYDHKDKKMPHIMFFAAENIPPLKELTFHYNYTIDQVHDSDGNIKKKRCYCGSTECVGRLY